MDVKTLKSLKQAKAGSYYTIRGAGGDLKEWVEGYEEFLAAEKIGKPVEWLKASGAQVNEYAGEVVPDEGRFDPDLTFLMFPLDGLDVSRLAMFRIKMGDTWFDDMIDNMRRSA